MRYLILALVLLANLALAAAQTSSSAALRVGIVGLTHGHVEGFFEHSLHRPEIQIVGISEPNQQVASRYAEQFKIDHSFFYTDLRSHAGKVEPQAVLVYTNTFDHRKVIEICARHGIHVMVEKPLAVSLTTRAPSSMPRMPEKFKWWSITRRPGIAVTGLPTI